MSYMSLFRYLSRKGMGHCRVYGWNIVDMDWCVESLVMSCLWNPIDKTGSGKGLFLVFFCQTISYFLIATKVNYSMIIYISILLFGPVAWSVPSIMAALMGDILGSEKTDAGFWFYNLYLRTWTDYRAFCCRFFGRKDRKTLNWILYGNPGNLHCNGIKHSLREKWSLRLE